MKDTEGQTGGRKGGLGAEASRCERTNDERVQTLDALFELRNLVDRAILAEVAEFDSAEAYKEDGCVTTEGWLSYRHNLLPATSKEIVRTAKLLPNLPEIASSFEEGLISRDQITLLCQFVEPEEDALWSEIAQKESAAMIRRARRLARRLSPDEVKDAQESRYLRIYSAGDDLTCNISGRLPAASGELVRLALERRADEMKPDLPVSEGGRWAPHGQRMADALVEACGDFESSRPSEAPRATVVVHVEAGDLDHVAGKGMLPDGTPVAHQTVQRLCCDSRLQVAVTDPSGKVLGVSSVRRTFTPSQFRILMGRDKGCVFLGCGRTRGLIAHHLEPHAHGGATATENGGLVCFRHHQAVHEGGFQLIRTKYGDWVVVRPDGRVVRRARDSLRDRGSPRGGSDDEGPASARAA